MIRYTDSAGKLLHLYPEYLLAKPPPGRRVQTAGNPLEQETAPDAQQDGGHAMKRTGAPESNHEGICRPDRVYAYLPAGEEICTELYLGRTKNICTADGIYNNTDKSLIPLGANPRLAGLLCGKGYHKSQEDMIQEGLFRDEDFREYDDLRYTSLRDIKRANEVRFRLGDTDRPEGYPMLVPYRTRGTEKDIIREMKARGFTGYMDYMYIQDRCPKHVLALRLGAGYIVMGDMAHNFAVHAQLPDDITRYPGVQKNVGLCAILQEDLYIRLPDLRQRYPVCICPDGMEIRMYSKIRSRMKSFRCVNETKWEYNIR